MNIHSLQSLFKKCLNIGLMCLSFLIVSQENIFAQQTSLQRVQDTIIVNLSDSIGKITNFQLNDVLIPSGMLFYENQNVLEPTDTNWLPKRTDIFNGNTATERDVFIIRCDTAVTSATLGTNINPVMGLYGQSNIGDVDTITHLSSVRFFNYSTQPDNNNVAGSQAVINGLRNGFPTPLPLSGSGAGVGAGKIFFKIRDIGKPVARCIPSGTPVSLDSLGLITAADLNDGSTDNCTPNDKLIFSIASDTIRCDSIDKLPFTVTVVLTVTDEAGNSDTCSTTINIIDNAGPIFQNVPADDTLACGDAIPPQMTLTAIDNCTPVPADSISMDTMSNRPIIFKENSFAPLFDTITVDSLLRDSAYYNYDITYSWTATDTFSNPTTVKQVIRVRDTLAPTFALDTLYLVPTSDNSTTCSGTITLDLLGNISDQCSDTLKRIIVTGTNTMDIIHDTLEVLTLNLEMGDTIINIIAEDFSNNRDTQKIIIRVDDRTAPTPRCNGNIGVNINAFGFAAIDSSVVNLNSIDNCTNANGLRFELSQDTFRCADIGQTIPIIMTVIDEAGNRNFCESNIVVGDFAGTGSFACPADITVPCDPTGASLVPGMTGEPTRMDVCGTDSELTFTDEMVAGPRGMTNICQVIERTWTLRDTITGTVTNCLQRISLIDEEAPELDTTYADAIIECIDEAMTLTADSILVTDNCMEDVYVQAEDTVFMGVDTITLRRIWTAFDSCRTTADTQYIKIFDDIAPVVALPADTVFNTGDFNPDSCGVLVNIDFEAYITDCNASLGLSIGYEVQDSSFKDTTVLSQYFPIGEYRVIVIAKDSSNNIGRDTIIIDVNDTSTPTVVCVENIVVSLGSGGTGVLEVADVLIRASDNCGATLPDTLAALSQSIFDCSDLGLKEIALTVTDTSGNVGVCMVNVTVVNQGNSDFISIVTDSLDESLTGLNDGQVWVNVTGGSGNYTVQWNDPANSTTDTITNLAPGLYMVTVNDASTGCRLTDTIRVNAGGTISYVIGEVSGAPGTVVQVPISVMNFINVTNIDMALTISDPSVGQFIPNNLAGGFNNVTIDIDDFIIDTNDPNRLRIVPRLADNNGETVPDGTVIFYVNIQIPANASINDTTIITAAGDEVADIKTGLVIGGSAMELTSTSSIGKITVIDPGVGVVVVGGKINLISGDPLVDATVVLSGDVSSEDSTKTDGRYNFMITEGQNVTITPTENEHARNGLSTFDLVLIQDHINGRLLDSPYKRLAADINKSGSITIFDIIEIQDVILRRITSFTDVPSWTFVPASHTFTNQANPWGGTVPTSITTTASAADSALNFIAIKTGDVSLDADEVRFQDNATATDRNKDFAFKVTDQLVKAGTYIEVPFKADNFDQIRGYQMTLDIATEWLTFETVKPGALTDVSTNNFSLTNIAKGQIATNWFNSEAKTVDADKTLFTLVFKVEKTGRQLSDLLQITSDMIHAEAYTDELFYNGIDLVFEDHPAVAGTYELFQNKPNPFRNETTVSFNLPEKAPVTLRFFDFSGRLTHQVKGNYAQGMNNITIRKNDLATNGVLYYELSTPGFTARKKMIVLE